MLAILLLGLSVQAAGSPAAKAPDKPRLICRDVEQELGSHMHTGHRCKTAEEWNLDQVREQAPTTLRLLPGRDNGLPGTKRPPP